MPIRPEMRPLYPPPREWRELRARILERAGHACECRGECGHDHDGGRGALGTSARCRAPHGRTVHRYAYDYARPGRGWVDTWDEEPDAGADLEACGDDPRNNDPSNLAALCQRCHLRYDRDHHAETRRGTRNAQTGQGRLVP